MKILAAMYKTSLKTAKIARALWFIVLVISLILSLVHREFTAYIILGIFLGLAAEQTWWWNLLFSKKKLKRLAVILVGDYVKSWVENRRKIKL